MIDEELDSNKDQKTYLRPGCKVAREPCVVQIPTIYETRDEGFEGDHDSEQKEQGRYGTT